MGCGMCGKCTKLCGSLMLVLGVLFLLQDLNVWNFFNISWYSAAFILAGMAGFAKTGCPDCCKMNEGKKK